MEVGAVKQAFNNEVILLKKKLDQAKIQIINKLTRKAKNLTQKKAPEHLAEKLKRKATAAVNDVMAIKKINNKELAKFAITHTGNLNDFLNKPTTSPAERACARLLLHKALQDKYQLLRSRFTNVPIKDLFMSRQERLKIKKEEKEKQKLKKKEKEDRKRKRESVKKNEKAPIQAEGDWSVEDIDIDELILNKKFVPKRKMEDDSDIDGSDSQSGNKRDATKIEYVSQDSNLLNSDGGSDNESEVEKAESDSKLSANESGDNIDNDEVLYNSGDDNDNDDDNDDDDDDDDEEDNDQHAVEDGDDDSSPLPNSNLGNEHTGEDDDNKEPNSDLGDEESESDNESKETKQTELAKVRNNKTDNLKVRPPLNKTPGKEDNRKKLPKLNKDKSKTKSFSEKMQTKKKSKKDSDDIETPQGNKIVDPFFITATGGNYMSVAEPRGPDEVKDVHKQGNRQMRRAAMFGYVPKTRPKFKNNFSNNQHSEKGNFSNNNGNSRFSEKNGKFDRQNGFRNRDTGHHENKFEKQGGYQNGQFGNKNFKSNAFNDRSKDNGDQRQNFKRKFEAADKFDKKSSEPEKLHPSWAAKKKISGIQPFQGKKTVFE